MSAASPVAPTSKAMVWSGRIISTLLVLLLTMSATMKLTQAKDAVEGFKKLGYPDNALVPIGITEVVCTVLYVIPQTSVLGAILLTGYLGGATATHVIGGESVIPPVVIGMLVWLGLYLRDSRIRALIPWKQ